MRPDWWNEPDPIDLIAANYGMLVDVEWSQGGWPLLRLLTRFWSRVDRSGSCWDWTGGSDKNGYGRLNVDGFIPGVRSTTAPKMALILTTGQMPPLDPASGRRMDSRHSCDRPPCVRPEHLSFGTRTQNMADMTERGRRRGCAPTFTQAEIDTMRRLAGTMSQAKIGKLVGCSQSHVSNVLAGKYRRTEGGDAQ